MFVCRVNAAGYVRPTILVYSRLSELKWGTHPVPWMPLAVLASNPQARSPPHLTNLRSRNTTTKTPYLALTHGWTVPPASFFLTYRTCDLRHPLRFKSCSYRLCDKNVGVTIGEPLRPAHLHLVVRSSRKCLVVCTTPRQTLPTATLNLVCYSLVLFVRGLFSRLFCFAPNNNSY